MRRMSTLSDLLHVVKGASRYFLAVCTALHNMEGGPELVMTLLEHGADVNEVGEVDGDEGTPLWLTVCAMCDHG